MEIDSIGEILISYQFILYINFHLSFSTFTLGISTFHSKLPFPSVNAGGIQICT